MCVLARLLIDLRCGLRALWIHAHAAENLLPFMLLLPLKVWVSVRDAKMTVFAWQNHVGLGANGFIISVSGTIQCN